MPSQRPFASGSSSSIVPTAKCHFNPAQAHLSLPKITEKNKEMIPGLNMEVKVLSINTHKVRVFQRKMGLCKLASCH